MKKLEQKLIELGYEFHYDKFWTKTTKVYFKELDSNWYIGIIIDIEEQEIALHYVRNDNPPKVYMQGEFNDLFEIYNQYKKDLEVLKDVK